MKKLVGRIFGGTFGLACIASLALSVPGASSAGCPNEGLREAQGITALPSCMALEMVSPSKKFAQPAYSASFSADGDRVLFNAQVALGQTPGFQHFGGDFYVASRGGSGWETASTSPPLPTLVDGGAHYGGPSIFTPDLSGWVQFVASRSQSIVGVAQLFSGGLDGSFAPLSPLLQPIDNSGSPQIQFAVGQLAVNQASTDLSTVVLRVRGALTSYLPEDPSNPPGIDAEEAGGDRNSYVAFLDEGVPTLQLLARDNAGTVYGGRCRAHLGGTDTTVYQGAMSADGSRVYFSTRPAQPFDSETGEGPACDTANPIRILKRTATEAGPEIAPLLPGGPSEWEQAGDDLYQGASADGTKVYFTSPRKLTASDIDPSAEPCGAAIGKSAGCDLYLFDSSKPESERLTQVSAGGTGDPSPGQGAAVLSSITAISGDGSHAYFVAQGVLTTDPNPEGSIAQAGQPNLYVYNAEADDTAFVGTLAGGDKGGMWGAEGSFFGDAYAAPLYGPGGPSQEVGGDGHVLAFASEAPLADEDSDGGRRDVFRYDADAGTLERISRASPGGSDDGPFDATVNPNVRKTEETNFDERSRWVGEDGQTVAFATAEALLPGDEDGVKNPYVWKSGQSGVIGAEVEHPPAVSPTGREISFSTRTALLPQDRDTAEDVYVARGDGGFPNPEVPRVCDPLVEGACSGPPSVGPPPVPGPSSDASGNVQKCKKGFVKKKGRCVKKPRKHKAKKRAGHKQGDNR